LPPGTGCFPRLGGAEAEAGPTAEAILDLFIEGIPSYPADLTSRAAKR
jgi:hypothetical protein